MKAVIVEDESVIRNGLMKHIPWKKLEIEEVCSAANATEALDVCREFLPDIIVSDICMPGDNGVRLCEKLREILPDCQIIFVTGYAEKEYLKAAINLQAVKYIEKPVHIPEISDAIKEAVDRVTKKQNQKQAYLHSLLLNSENAPLSLINASSFFVLIIHTQNNPSLSKLNERLQNNISEMAEKDGIQFMGEVFDEINLAFLLCGDCIEDKKKRIVEYFAEQLNNYTEEGERWFLAVGYEVKSLKEIRQSYNAALSSLKCLSYKGWNQITYAEEVEKKSKEAKIENDIMERFATMISKNFEEKAEEILNNITIKLKNEKTYINYDIRYLYRSLDQIVTNAERVFRLEKAKKTLEYSEGSFFDNAETLDELNEYLIKHIHDVFSESEDKEEQNNNYLVKKVTDYILENYSDSSLSIKVLANSVFLTPTYLSNLFKKKTGTTIGQYMVDVRIEHAKRLMKDPQLKFYQVSSMVGYEDANYFAKIFKKKTGITPSEYKESLSIK